MTHTQDTTTLGEPRRVFRDRREAGQVLSGLLTAYRNRDDVLVLGLARGGVPVAWEVAAALGAPLDTFIVRKLGAPGHEEFAIGAVARGGRVVVNDDIIRALRVSPQQLRDIVEREGRELLRREAAYRGERPPIEVTGKTVILVDDGLATGSSMYAAVQTLRDEDAAEIVVAVPAAPESTCRAFADVVDDMVCASMPTPFVAVGESFWDFRQVSDDEVRDYLAKPTTGPANVSVLTEPTPIDVVNRCAVDAPHGVPPHEVLDEIIGDAQIVLIGESSHGTHEFYSARAAITKWLISERGFCAVAVEADWPDAYRVNRYVRGLGTDQTADQALRGFERFPSWMWRNVDVRDFVQWLHRHNQRCDSAGSTPAGFYGLDLYSLHRSMQEVINYLENVDPAAAGRARNRYACFDRTAGDDGQAYGFAAAFGAGLSCERQVIAQLTDMQRNALTLARRDGMVGEDELFYATQNALTVRNAEEYYRAMFGGRVTSWNLRDRHMHQTLQALSAHLGRDGRKPARIVLWAHNSHVGDARATEVSADGQLTLGQLARQTYADSARLIGMTTYTGSVTAASEWGGPAERKTVRPALNGSVEELFHATGRDAFLISPRISRWADEPLSTVRLGRAIGVIYLPATERQSHYLHVRSADQFDAIIHIDRTSALEPLEVNSRWVAGETPETFPTGL